MLSRPGPSAAACLLLALLFSWATPARATQSQVIEHYYSTILGRSADAAGLAYWLDESGRMTAEGVDPAEALRALALAFHGSPEFASRGLSDTALVDNLYLTFFNRAADAAGRSYWQGQLAAGLTREMVTNSFLFSAEFAAYVSANAGSVASRGEVYGVIDFYRGAFARLPDSAGLRHWLGQFRGAQCQAASGRAAAVRQAAHEIALLFFASPEYALRNRSDAQYVGDLYNAFLRRGADAAGFSFWVNALRTQSRAQVLQSFLDAPEFANRVAATASAGCVRLATPTVSTVAAATVSSVPYDSSSKLLVSWGAPAEITATSYKVTAVDAIGDDTTSVTTTGTSTQLTALKSATAYSITVAPCAAFSTATVCYDSPATAAPGTTPSEVWHFQGSGSTVAGLTPIVSDGNVRISATRFGADASAGMAGKVQIYYGPRMVNPQALTVGTNLSPATVGTPSTYLSFTSNATSSGLKSPPTASALVKQVATGQGVPLSAALGGKVRLFFEANGVDNKTRILWVDSVDGYVGRDFHAGAASQCSLQADYDPGGGCAPTLAIGVEGDAVLGNPKIPNARQNKVGWPLLDDWRWNGAAGTFMVFTTDMVSGCATTQMNHGYAAWDGAKWAVQYEASGCPKLFKGAQAMLPMHLGGVRYKMYYGDTTDNTGRTNSQLPFLGPKKLIYANGAKTGAASVVDYEDWEPVTAGRDVIFLWPNGTRLDATAEGFIDDFHFLSPTGTLDLQVAYIAITDGSVVPVAVAAVLVNP